MSSFRDENLPIPDTLDASVRDWPQLRGHELVVVRGTDAHINATRKRLAKRYAMLFINDKIRDFRIAAGWQASDTYEIRLGGCKIFRTRLAGCIPDAKLTLNLPKFPIRKLKQRYT